MKLKISEIFYSIDGEAPHVGRPAIFIRFAGCPLQCKFFDASGKQTDCDTSYAQSATAKDVKEMTIDEILEEVKKFPCYKINITGGEPLSQRKQCYELIKALSKENYFVEIETSGYFPFIDFENDYKEEIDFYTVTYWNTVQWNISPKLSSVVTAVKENYNINTLKQFITFTHCKAIFKFVITNAVKDIGEINKIVYFTNMDKNRNCIFLMPEGFNRDNVVKNSEEVIELCKKWNYNYSPRLHIMIWDQKRGV